MVPRTWHETLNFMDQSLFAHSGILRSNVLKYSTAGFHVVHTGFITKNEGIITQISTSALFGLKGMIYLCTGLIDSIEACY